MNNIIEAWASISSGEYIFLNEGDYNVRGEKTGKLNFRQVLLLTQDYLKQVRASDINGNEIFKAAITINERCSKVLDKPSFVERRFVKIFNHGICSLHKKIGHNIAQLMLTNDEKTFFRAMSLISSMQNDVNQSQIILLKKILQLGSKSIKRRHKCDGFVWKITNKQSVEHYIIGTEHFGRSQWKKHAGIQASIKNSDEFIFEVGKYTIPIAIIGKVKNIFNDYSFSLDGYIASKAFLKGKKISRFETVLDQLRELNDYISSISNVRSYMTQVKISDYQLAVMVDLWQRSDIKVIKDMPVTSFVENRNKKWLQKEFDGQTLVEKFKDARKPISIICGVSHVLMDIDSNFLKVFKEDGNFTIQQINFEGNVMEENPIDIP